MLNLMKKNLELPELYKETEAAFWDDDYISEQMLKAHLDPEFNGASRRLDFIEKSVSWIQGLVPPQSAPALLDVGCGPGLYAERFARCGYQVHGVDFSRRSVNYARASAKQAGLEINYTCQNYLKLDLGKQFDLATMIYCDYGVLSRSNREILMKKLYQHLRPGGKLLLDVFSMEQYNNFQEQQTWELCPNGCFWRKTEYLVLNRNRRYPGGVTLEQVLVAADGDFTAYYLWNTCFTRESLIEEAKEFGFKTCEIYGDVAGSQYSRKSPTIAALFEK